MWEKRNNLKVIQYRVSIHQHYLMSNFSSFIVFCIYFFIWKLGWLYIFKFFGTLCSSNETIETEQNSWMKKKNQIKSMCGLSAGFSPSGFQCGHACTCPELLRGRPSRTIWVRSCPASMPSAGYSKRTWTCGRGRTPGWTPSSIWSRSLDARR